MTRRVIRVDIAMSALSSAILNTGHSRAGPRAVCLAPPCVRSANNWHGRRSSCVLPSVDLANMTHGDRPNFGITAAMSLHEVCCPSASPYFCLIAPWRRTAQERRARVSSLCSKEGILRSLAWQAGALAVSQPSTPWKFADSIDMLPRACPSH